MNILNFLYEEFKILGYKVDMYEDDRLWVWLENGFNVTITDDGGRFELETVEKTDDEMTETGNTKYVRSVKGIRNYVNKYLPLNK